MTQPPPPPADAPAPPADAPPAYPLPAPAEDPRFTVGLVFDIADVLTRHGYPHPSSTDWAHLMTAVSSFLYHPEPYQPEQETR